MQKKSTLTWLKQFFSKVLPLFILIAFTVNQSNAQYFNGNLSTGATSSNGSAAPAGSTWSEVQNGNVTSGYGAQISASNFIADDFTVPAGQIWTVSKFTCYAYSSGYAGTTTPFNDLRVAIYNTDPSVGSPTPVAGSLATNIFSSSTSENMYRIFWATPGTTRIIWNIAGNIATTLNPGHYWVVWQNGTITAGASNFMPPSTVVGTVTQAGNNAKQSQAGVWANLVDGANPQDMPFKIDYINSGTTCVPATTPTITGNTNICVGTSTTLTANGTLGSATAWKWYTGSCGGTLVNTGTTFTVTPPAGTTTYYVRGEGGICTSPGACGTITITPSQGSTAAVLSQVSGAAVPVNLFNETFATVLPAGWAQQNLSSPIGTTNWFVGNSGVFPANSTNDYIAANFQNTTGTNTISNWLFAPNVTLKNGDKFSFYTRTTTGAFPDRLQVRLSTNGASVNVGTTNVSTGDFSTLLLDINPAYSNTAYPTAWTQYTLVMSGLPAAGVSGRLAFRYFVEGGGPSGNNSDYIGIDDVVYSTTTTSVPTTCTGSTTNIKVDITGGTSPYTVVYFNGVSNVTVTNYISGTNIPVTPAAATTYTLVSVTGAIGCVGTGNSGTVTITPSALTVSPLIVTAVPTTAICAGDPVLMTATAPPTIVPFTSTVPITISTAAPPTNVSLYPGTIAVAGLPTTGVTVKSVSLNNAIHTFTSDLDILLQSPTGQYVTILSDAGGGGDLGTALGVGATYTFMDGAPAFPAGGSPQYITPGTYKPTNLGASDTYPAPGPGTITDATPLLSTFTGNFNGTWNLYVVDQFLGDGGVIPTWTINFSLPSAIPVGYTYSWTPSAGLSVPTNNPIGASPMSTTTYTVMGTAPNGCQTTANYTINVNQLPAITTNPVDSTVCDGLPASFTGAASGAGLTYQWQVSTTGCAGTFVNLTNAAPYSGVTTTTLNISVATLAMNGYAYRLVASGTCSPAANSTCALLNIKSLPAVSVVPNPTCGGIAGVNGTLLSTVSLAPPVPGSATFSNAATVAVPDNSAAGATSIITVSGIPANATVTNVTTTLNMSHTYPGDMIFNLKNPNGTIANIYKYNGGTGTGAVSGPPTWGWYGAKVSGPPTGTVAFSSILTPFIYNATTNFKPDLIDAAVAGVTIQNPTGYVSNCTSWSNLYTATPTGPNGVWTLAMADGGAGDVGSLTGWSLKIDYTTPGTGPGGALTYTWSPATGLYTNATATTPYVAGTQTPSVYAAPTVNTTYTISGTSATTGCVGTGTAVVNYTPTAPTVSPTSITKCAGTAAQAISVTSALAPTTVTFTPVTAQQTGTILPSPAVAGISRTVAVAGIPAGATISEASIRLNISNDWPSDYVMVLKSPTGAIFNLSYLMSSPNAALYDKVGVNMRNTVISSAGVTFLQQGTAPWTGKFKGDGAIAVIPAIGAPTGPTGFTPTVANFTGLWDPANSTSVNGTWTLAIYSAGGPNNGTLDSWDLTFTYGVPSAGVWTPAAGLYTNAAATTPYTAGTSVSPVYANPTATTTYSVTVATATCTSAPTTVLVTVNDTVKITTQPVDASICTGSSAVFTSAAVGTGLTYQWQVSADNGATWSNVSGSYYTGSTTNTLSVTAAPVSYNGNLYRVIVTGTCNSKTSNSAKLTVPSVSLAPLMTSILPGLSTTLVATVIPTPVSYAWYLNGVLYSTTTINKITVNVDGVGDWTVRSSDVSGCSNVSNVATIKDSTSSNVFIYPNPNNGQFQVRYYGKNNVLPKGLNLYDAKGSRVEVKYYPSITSPYDRMDVDLRRYGRGIYWVEVVDVNMNRLAMGRVDVQ